MDVRIVRLVHIVGLLDQQKLFLSLVSTLSKNNPLGDIRQRTCYFHVFTLHPKLLSISLTTPPARRTLKIIYKSRHIQLKYLVDQLTNIPAIIISIDYPVYISIYEAITHENRLHVISERGEGINYIR